jgi:hypothetical protein
MEDGEVEVMRMEARMLRIEHELLELEAEIRGKEAAAQGAEGEAQVAGCQEGWRNAKERTRVPAYATRGGGEGSRKSSTRSIRAKDVLEEREQQMHHWQNEGVSTNLSYAPERPFTYFSSSATRPKTASPFASTASSFTKPMSTSSSFASASSLPAEPTPTSSSFTSASLTANSSSTVPNGAYNTDR